MGAASERPSSTDSAEGRLVVVSGPSGVGKSSIVDAVLERTGARFSVSATTRGPRPGETDGGDYHFVTLEEFEQMIGGDELLEWARYGGHYYGTPRKPVVTALAAGENVILDIENEGARHVTEAFPDAIGIFVVPPSLTELERRLRSRGDTDDGAITRRLGVAEQQIAEAPAIYDHLVVNDDLTAAIEEVVKLVATVL